jgi:hypothetical protein
LIVVVIGQPVGVEEVLDVVDHGGEGSREDGKGQRQGQEGKAESSGNEHGGVSVATDGERASETG